MGNLATWVAGADAQTPGPDYVACANVEFMTHLKEVGDGVGATIIDKRLLRDPGPLPDSALQQGFSRVGGPRFELGTSCL